MTITIGADPEVFLRELSTNKIVAAIGRLGGTKDAPIPTEFGAVQEDNVLAEFNIHPASKADEMVHNIRAVLHDVTRITGCEPVIKASHEFDVGYLQALGKQAVHMGCEPDYCAYTTQPNIKPNPYQGLRTAGGHVHVGAPLLLPIKDVIKVMDLYLGLPSVILDDDTRRRTMYGGAGCYREKPYGLEYRTLSNFWLRSDNLIRWVFHTAVKCANISELPAVDWDVVRDTINSGDVPTAKRLCAELAIPVPRN